MVRTDKEMADGGERGRQKAATGAEGTAVVAADSGLMLVRPAGPGK